MIGTDVRHRNVVTNGVRLHVVDAGRGVPVVLLHGFPEFWYAWRRQIGPLARAGARVLAPDLRGYGISEKPHGVDAYRIHRLRDDVVGLLEQEAPEGAVLVGHDWGGALAWRVALDRPDLLRRLVVLNAPHPELYARGLRRPRQLLRSWYVLAFQVPRLPELALRAFDFAVLERTWRRDPVREDAFGDADIAAYKAALARPGAVRSTVNWYRAAFGGRGTASRAPERPSTGGGEGVTVPTLVIWGERDRYLGTELLDGLDDLVRDLRVERVPDASHWIQADAPERVNRLLVDVVESELRA